MVYAKAASRVAGLRTSSPPREASADLVGAHKAVAGRALHQAIVAPLAPVRVNTSRMSERYYATAVRAALADLGWAEVGAGTACELHWFDAPISRAHFAAVKPGQAINRFYGMVRLCRKVCLAQQLRWNELLLGPACRVAPGTWCLPAELERFTAFEARGNADAFFIFKPDAGCQGSGIALIQASEVERRAAELRQAGARAVVQAYVPRPLLLDGFKFDLRLYALLLCAQPFEAYLCTHGLARFATEPYEEPSAANAHRLLMHLTNSSLNTAAEGKSNKRSWAAVHAALAASGGLADGAGAWPSVVAVVTCALRAICPLAAELHAEVFPETASAPAPPARPAPAGSWARTSFQVIGVDVLLSERGTAHLLELNHSPSMALDPASADADERAAKMHAITAALKLARTRGAGDEAVPAICAAHGLERLHAQPWPPDGTPAQDAEVAAEARALFAVHALPRPRDSSQPAPGRTVSRAAFMALARRARVEPAAAAHVFAEALAGADAMGTGWEGRGSIEVSATRVGAGELGGCLPFHAFFNALLSLAPLCAPLQANGAVWEGARASNAGLGGRRLAAEMRAMMRTMHTATAEVTRSMVRSSTAAPSQSMGGRDGAEVGIRSSATCDHQRRRPSGRQADGGRS